MNKNGNLLTEEVLKMVAGVIALVILFGVLASIYFNKVNERKRVEAEATLERISSIISEIGEGDFKIYEVQNPSGWRFFGFILGAGKSIPNSCGEFSCLCICDESFLSDQSKSCQKNGACKKIESLREVESVEISSPNDGLTKIKIIKNAEGVFIKGVK